MRECISFVHVAGHAVRSLFGTATTSAIRVRLRSLVPRLCLRLAARMNGLRITVPDYWTAEEIVAFAAAPDAETLRKLCVAALEAGVFDAPAAPAQEASVLPQASFDRDAALSMLALNALTRRPSSWRAE